MAWGERFKGMEQSLPGLVQGLQQKEEQEQAQEGGLLAGMFQMLGGAIAMCIPGGQVAGMGMFTSGIGRAAGG